MIPCTRCEATGFLNIAQVDDATRKDFDESGDHIIITKWIDNHQSHDVQVCDCCGDGDAWYGEPGKHYGNDDQPGINGPYAYHGGLCECN